MPVIELTFIVSMMNIYTYLNSPHHHNSEIGRLNYSCPGAGAGAGDDTDLSVTFIAPPAGKKHNLHTLFTSVSKINRYSLCFICGGL